MSLKNLIGKNFIIYKIYLYYNLFLKHKAYKKRDYYSQWGEDLFINEYFKNIQKGFYVDIGSYHPVMYSNTCLLFNKGWRGMNVDLNQTSIDLFNIMRPRDFNVCAAISDREEERDLFFDHPFSPVNTIEETFYNKSNKKLAFRNFKKRKIKTKKFENIVKEISDISKIDFLNIDCEGFDYFVLKGFNLEKYAPMLICIELYSSDGEKADRYDDVIGLLNKNRYRFVKKSGPSSFFEKR